MQGQKPTKILLLPKAALLYLLALLENHRRKHLSHFVNAHFPCGATALASVLEKKGQGECLPQRNPALRLGMLEATLAQAWALLHTVRVRRL